MQELQSRNAGIIRMCYDMHGENAEAQSQNKMLELLGLWSGRASKSTETQKELKWPKSDPK